MLTLVDLTVLALEGDPSLTRRQREDAAHDVLGVLAPRYHQLVLAAASKPEALALDPVTVHRLQRLRAAGRASRRAS